MGLCIAFRAICVFLHACEPLFPSIQKRRFVVEFETKDWERFRTIEGLSSKAGVPRDMIAVLVAKELMDNALDASTDNRCWIEQVGIDGFIIGDNGIGLDPTKVADLFSINRPLKSTKRLRLPTRGALGNGLRVVAGAVLATGGSLRVTTRGQILELTPQPNNGTTSAEVIIGNQDRRGTVIEVHLGGDDAGPIDLRWANMARHLSSGNPTQYNGNTSPWWYTSRDFYEICLSAKDTTIRDLISKFEGCSRNVGEITEGFKGKQTTDLSLEDAKTLLDRMRYVSKPVTPERLGCCDSGCFSNYVKIFRTFTVVSNNETATIPFVVEAWVDVADEQDAAIYVNVNRTPITGEVTAYHSKAQLTLWGCGLEHSLEVGRRPPIVVLNIITPFMPITSDGKAPDLQYFVVDIMAAIEKSINKAKKNAPKNHARSQKEIVIEMIPQAAKKMGGGHRFSLRQLYYAIRPSVKTELNEELAYGNFGKIITEYEGERGEDLPGMYRDDRGTVYHPHLGEQIALGTRMVETYKPPKWTFNKVLYIEKEGFFQGLQDVKWPERHDCALITAKGYSSRAARDLLDLLGDCGEELIFFCVHDADASGTMIYQTLQEETKARPGRKFEIINLGLESWEGVAMGMEPENLEYSKKHKAVGDYVLAHDPKYEKWLQDKRIELNEMSTPQFLQWLDDKMEQYSQGKLIAPNDIMTQELHNQAYEILKQTLIDEILQENDLEGRLNCEYEKLIPILNEKAKELTTNVTVALQKEPAQSWRNPVLRVAEDVVESSNP